MQTEPLAFTGVERVEIRTGSVDDNLLIEGYVPHTIATDDGADSVHATLGGRGQVNISTGAGRISPERTSLADREGGSTPEAPAAGPEPVLIAAS